jgi:hypothetical protein
MRKEMNEIICTRILIRGKIAGFEGRYPRILEETFLTLKKKNLSS